jgi:hypothetical protein
MRFILRTAVGAGLLSALLLAQTEKVTISMAPRPGQTVHYVTTQDIAMEAAMDSPPGQPPTIPPVKLIGRMTFAFTETGGSPDAEGRLTVLLTCEQANGEMSLNGIPLPTAADLPQLVGKPLTLVFGADGKLADVTAPPELASMLEPAKQFIMTIHKTIPTVPLGVGDSSTSPFSLPLPIPVPGGDPVVMDGHVKTTLLSLDAEGADRVAKYDQSFEAAMVQAPSVPGQSPPRTMSVEMKMQGTGKLQFNVDRAVIRSNETETVVDGAIGFAGSGSDAPPKAKIHGVIKMTVTGK